MVVFGAMWILQVVPVEIYSHPKGSLIILGLMRLVPLHHEVAPCAPHPPFVEALDVPRLIIPL